MPAPVSMSRSARATSVILAPLEVFCRRSPGVPGNISCLLLAVVGMRGAGCACVVALGYEGCRSYQGDPSPLETRVRSLSPAYLVNVMPLPPVLRGMTGVFVRASSFVLYRASSNACAKADIVGNRSSGFFARARRSTRSSVVGICWLNVLGGCG